MSKRFLLQHEKHSAKIRVYVREKRKIPLNSDALQFPKKWRHWAEGYAKQQRSVLANIYTFDNFIFEQFC